MDFSQVLIPPGFALPKQSIVADKTPSMAVNKRKRFRESTNTPSTSVHDPGRHNLPEEPTDAPAIKQRAVSALPATSPMPEPARASCFSPATFFKLAPERELEAASDARLIATIDQFPPAMHEQLQSFRYDQNIRTVLTNASVLLTLLNTREIGLSRRHKEPYTPTLFNLPERCNLTNEHEMVSDYFRKATVFFAAVDAEKIYNTGCLTSMLQCKKHVRTFNKMADDDIQRIAINPQLRHLSCIYTGKGMPNPEIFGESSTDATAKPASTDAALDIILRKFYPNHQKYLRNNLDDQRCRAVINCADTLIGTLKQRGIRLSVGRRRTQPALLFDIIRNLDLDKDYWLILSFFRQAVLFFTNVNTSRVKTTECLHNMLQHRLHIEMFVNMNDIGIIMVARHPLLVPISQRFRKSGLPDPALIGKITRLKEINAVLLSPIITNTRGAYAALEEVVYYFLPEHTTVLRRHQHIECIQLLLKKAVRLIDTLLKRRINLAMNRDEPPTPSLFSSLKCFKVIDDYHLMTEYFHKAEVFFAAVNNTEIHDTCCFSIMFRRQWHIRSLVETSDDDIRKFAHSPCLRQLCVAHTAKGLPSLERMNEFAGLAKLPGWERLFSLVTAVCYRKGIPSIDRVRTFIRTLQDQDQMVISTIGSICKGQGIPDDGLLNDFLALKFAHKEETLGTLAMVCRSQGIPPANKVNEFLQWLPAEQTFTYMRLLCQFFIGTNVPELSALMAQEKALETIFYQNLPPQPETSLRQDRLKPFALFCVNPGKWRLDNEEFKDFLDATHFPSRQLALDAMQSVVFNLGGPGIRLWLAKYRDNCQDMDTVTKALLIPASLQMVSFALSNLPASQWLTYITLCKNLSPIPNQKQWELLQGMMKIVDDNFPSSSTQKQMLLEILWNQDKCWKYVSRINSLLKTVPTIRQLYYVSTQLNKPRMKAFLDACIALHPIKSRPPKLPDIEALVDGLLLAHYPIDCPGEIPDLCFSSIIDQDPDKSVTVDGALVMTGRQRLWHFVIAMLMELNRVGYEYTNKQLRFLSPNGYTIQLPRPRFTLTRSGFIIDNWSSRELAGFFRATDFEHYNTRPNICEILAHDHRHKAADMDAMDDEKVMAQATRNGLVISVNTLANSPWEDASTNLVQLIEPLDFSWLAREFEFPEDLAHSNPETSEMERMSAYLESELNAPPHNI